MWTEYDIVCIGGWAFSPRIFEPVIGQGMPGANSLYLDSNSRDVQEWFGAAGSQVQMNQVARASIVIAWSLGCIFVLRALSEGRLLAEHVLLVAPTPSFVNRPNWHFGKDESELRTLRSSLKRDMRACRERFISYCVAGEELPCPNKRVTPYLSDTSSEEHLLGLKVLQEHDVRAELRNIFVPVSILHGMNDAVISVGAGRELAARLPNASFYPIPGASHLLPVTRMQETVSFIRKAAKLLQ